MKSELSTPNERLQAFRKEKKLSGEALGAILGLTKSGLSNVENGRAKVSIEYLEILINTYPELNIYWLISGKGEMYISSHDKEAENCWKLLEVERIKSEGYLSILRDNSIKVSL